MSETCGVTEELWRPAKLSTLIAAALAIDEGIGIALQFVAKIEAEIANLPVTKKEEWRVTHTVVALKREIREMEHALQLLRKEGGAQ
jgi:hypothetical protein